MQQNDSIVIIPTYNEKENIEAIIRAVTGLQEHAFDILIIDDGSPDGTADIVKGLMAEEFKDRVFLVERQGLYKACAEEGYDVAVGSRYVSGVNVVNWPMGRVLMSYFASKYVRFVTGFPINDTTAGFKCYRRRVLETIDLDAIRFKGYAFQIEMKFTAFKYGFKIKEVPIIFVNRELGVSKMSGGIFSEALFGVLRLKIDSWFRKYN